MRRRIGRQPTASLLELAVAADPVAASRLVPRNGDVHETLEEVTLGGLRGAPGLFQLLVGREELAGPNQLQAPLERIEALACDVRQRP